MKTKTKWILMVVAAMAIVPLNIAGAENIDKNVTQSKAQPTGVTAQVLQAKEAQAASQVAAKNAIEQPVVSVQAISSTMPYTGVITNYDFKNPKSLTSPDVYAINYAYDRGGSAVATSIATINFTKQNGERLTRDELNIIINSLKTMPGTAQAPYWKTWASVKVVNGVYYWTNAPSSARVMNQIDVQLYSQWQKSLQVNPALQGVITNYDFKNPKSLTSPDVYAINYAYDRGGSAVATSIATINFTKQNGERLTRDELNIIINSLKTMPGTAQAPYWKTWASVKVVNGVYYWTNAPSSARVMNQIDVQLYSQWQKR